MKPFVRLLLVTVLALAVGFFAGLRTAASFERGYHSVQFIYNALEQQIGPTAIDAAHEHGGEIGRASCRERV